MFRHLLLAEHLLCCYGLLMLNTIIGISGRNSTNNVRLWRQMDSFRCEAVSEAGGFSAQTKGVQQGAIISAHESTSLSMCLPARSEPYRAFSKSRFKHFWQQSHSSVFRG